MREEFCSMAKYSDRKISVFWQTIQIDSGGTTPVPVQVIYYRTNIISHLDGRAEPQIKTKRSRYQGMYKQFEV